MRLWRQRPEPRPERPKAHSLILPYPPLILPLSSLHCLIATSHASLPLWPCLWPCPRVRVRVRCPSPSIRDIYIGEEAFRRTFGADRATDAFGREGTGTGRCGLRHEAMRGE